MHLFKSFIQDLDTSLSALPDNIELILLGDFNVNFTGSNLNFDKAMKRNVITQIPMNLTSLSTIQPLCLLPSSLCDKHRE